MKPTHRTVLRDGVYGFILYHSMKFLRTQEKKGLLLMKIWVQPLLFHEVSKNTGKEGIFIHSIVMKDFMMDGRMCMSVAVVEVKYIF
jgi:hypothetical protein